MYLAQNLKYLRERNGELQKDMCELLGVTEATMSKYESGYIEPDIEKLITLADHFGVTIDDLLRNDLCPKPMYARNLKHLRKKHGMSQKDVADLLEMGRSVVSLYEIGYREMSIEDLTILADYFGVTLDQMVKQDLSKEK